MGRATAHLFAQEGASVAVTDINEEGLARVVAEIKEEGGRAEGWRFDVFDGEQIKRVVKDVAERFGRLDIVINNAGFLPSGVSTMTATTPSGIARSVVC